MSNPIQNISLANTFAEWVVVTNDLVNITNGVLFTDYIKYSGTAYFNDPVLGISVSNNATFGGQVEIGGVGSSLLVRNNAEIQGELILSHENGNQTVFNADGVANVTYLNVTGAGQSANILNDLYVGGGIEASTIISTNLNVTNLYNNTINAAFDQANSAALFANGAFVRTNSVYAYANTGYLQANNAFNVTNVVFDVANSVSSFSNGAFTRANSAYAQANIASPAYDQANSASSFANGAFARANSGYDYANTGYLQANNAASFANSAFDQANSAASFANSAFTKANNALPLTGGTLSGILNGTTAAFSGGISVGGDFTIVGATIYSTDTFTLNANTIAPNRSAFFSSFRPASSANAVIRWYEPTLSWGIRDVNNSDTSTAYANIVTSNTTSTTTRAGIVQLSDSLSSTSTTIAPTSNAIKTVNDSVILNASSANVIISTANTNLKLYTDTQINANLVSAKAYTDSIVSANLSTALAYTDTANNYQTTYTNSANTKLKNYSDSTFLSKVTGGTVSGDMTVTGNLIINGTTTTVNTSTVATSDSLIELAKNNTVGDSLDIGFYGSYQTGGATRFTGLVRKASDKYYLIQGATTDPTTNVIDWSSFPIVPQRSTLDGNFTGGTVSGLSSAISVSDGGTGVQTIPTGRIVIGSGTSAVTTLSNTGVSVGSSNGAYVPIVSNDIWGRTSITGNVLIDTSFSSYSISGYNQANSAASFANGAFTLANNTTGVDNTQNTNILSAQSFANGAFDRANSAASFANGAFSKANSAGSFANAAFTKANNSVVSLTSNSQSQITQNAYSGSIVFGLAETGAAGVWGGSSTGVIQVPVTTIDLYGRATYTANVTTSVVNTITGNTNQITANTGTGNILLSLPQNIHTTANVQFFSANLLNMVATGNTYLGSLGVGEYASGTLGQIKATSQIISSTSQINSLGVGTAASGTAGEIRATNNITAYYSDERLKTKLGNIENALDIVDQLSGFYHEANEVAQSLGYKKVREIGVSAQEVQKVLPEIVAPAPIDEKYLTVRYERLTPLLIEAIKELRREINELKGK